MPPFQQSILQIGSAYVHQRVYKDFQVMSNELFFKERIRITIEDSYVPKYKLADELRRVVKYKDQKYSQFFDVKNDMYQLQNNTQAFADFMTYLDNLPPEAFEPPLVGYPSKNKVLTTLYSIPNKPSLDPRRSGMIIKIGPSQVMHDTTLRWLKNSAIDYGFVFYGPYDKSLWMYNKIIDTGKLIFSEVNALSDTLKYLF